MCANESDNYELEAGVMGTWITGMSLSTICLIVQLVLLFLKLDLRKIDQIILTQMSVARLMNSIVEYLSADTKHVGNKTAVKIILAVLYLQSDTVLVCWMFIYTKNLYDKVVQVFFFQKWSTFKLSLVIWLATLPIGLVYPLYIILSGAENYTKVYSVIKFIVLSVNMLFFCKIFYVIAMKYHGNSKNLRGIIKTCIISFLLVCITSLQVALTDLFSFYTKDSTVAISFCIINSFQVLAISIIFAILSKNSNNS